LIELLTALLILSALALMSYRGLGAVLDAREHVTRETDKWRRVAAFVARFERDVMLAAPRPVRSASGTAPAWPLAQP
jgi:general secretion pathway protein J